MRAAALRIPFDNIGAEEHVEGAGVHRQDPADPVEVLRRLWRELIEAPPWAWLAEVEGLVPWMSCALAQHHAQSLGIRYAGARPDVVERVHDKSWTQSCARTLGLDPELEELIVHLPCDEMCPERVRDVVAKWPAWARASFACKPVWGTSGRGRLRGREGALQVGPDWRPDAKRHRRGFLIEPWLERTADISSLWRIDEEGHLELLGVTRQEVRPSGLYLGCELAGTESVPMAATTFDDEFVDKSRRLVAAAAAEGMRGPCGVDGFIWRDQDGKARLRAAVELNARFTAGHVAVGLARKEGLPRGTRASFRLASSVPFRVLGAD